MSETNVSLRAMGSEMITNIFCKICVIFLICGPIFVHAQQTMDRWERVYTSEAFITEINLSTMRFEGNKTLRIQSRTILAEPTSLKGDSGPKYKTALQTVDFKMGTNQYRLSETKLLDVTDKVLQSSTAEDWRTIRTGGVMDNAIRTAVTITPFGEWKVDGYRFVDGNPSMAPEELESLIGSSVKFDLARAEVKTKVCTSLDFQDVRYAKEEFNHKFGFDPASIGVSAESIETTSLKCDVSGWRPPTSLLIKVSDQEMLMLWNGVFLVLRKDRDWTNLPKVNTPALPKPR